MLKGGRRVLREGMIHVDWSELTMSMMREKQFEACERRLLSYPSVGLFSEEATEVEEATEAESTAPAEEGAARIGAGRRRARRS